MSKAAILVVGTVLVLVGLGGMAITMAYQLPYSSGVGCPAVGPGINDQSAGMMGGMDAMFIQQMIPHHDDAIAMADLALTSAEHPELRQLAESIKRTQTAENAQMREWYREWFGADVPTGSESFGMMGGMMGGGMTDLEALSKADSFDKAFLEQMIPHHQMAIMMSRMAGGATGRPEMRDFTQSIIDTQSREIEQMQEWYREWYGR